MSKTQTDQVWYFAYGSNLNMGQMMTRVGEWTTSKRAVLKEHRLVFNSESRRWGGLTANIKKTGNSSDEVYGAVYRITDEKLCVLTSYEGVSPTDLTVEADQTQIRAKVYVFNSRKASGKPPDSYLNFLLSGLEQHGYSEEVIRAVSRMALRPAV